MLAATLHAPVADRRTVERPELGRSGTLRVGNALAATVIVLDLTREGCRIETDAVLPEDGVFGIGLAGIGITPARAVWHNVRGYGCEFVEPLASGAVTAAFQATNIAAFPLSIDAADQASVLTKTKWSTRATAALVISVAATSWAALVMTALALG